MKQNDNALMFSFWFFSILILFGLGGFIGWSEGVSSADKDPATMAAIVGTLKALPVFAAGIACWIVDKVRGYA